MKQKNNTTVDLLILIAAFVVAVAMRFVRLGVLPLNNMEAIIALQALAVGRGTNTLFGSHAAYVGLTGFDFYILTAGNFLARFWPAFFGALVVFVPHLFRDQICRWPAVILTSILAISPEMVGLSRIIGSPMMAFVCLLLAIGFFVKQKPVLSGIMLGFGLMSGSGFWMGILILIFSFLIAQWLFNLTEDLSFPSIPNQRAFWIHFGVSFAAVLIVVGSGFFTAPQGISGIFSGLADFINGFGSSYLRPYVLFPLALISYALSALIFGVWGTLRGILVKNKLDLFFVVWWMVALVFILLYPGSSTADLIWVTLPLWILSARVVYFAWRFPDSSQSIAIVTAVLVVVISAFMFLAVRSLLNPAVNQSRETTFFIALVGGVVLLVALILLVSFGWAEDVALSGLLMGLAIIIFASMISVSVNSTGLGPHVSVELWYPHEVSLSPDWMMISIDRVVGWNSSAGNTVEIAVTDSDTPAMRWVLRGYDPVHFESYLTPQSQSGILITDAQSIPEISNSYRGQKLVWSTAVPWHEMSSYQYLNWLITRAAPINRQQIILWVRTDLMPDSQFSR